MGMAGALIGIVDLLLRILNYIVIGYAILSWLVAFNVVNRYNDFVRQLQYIFDRILEPLLRPIRRVLPDLGGLDFSPMVLWLLILIARKLLAGAALDMGVY